MKLEIIDCYLSSNYRYNEGKVENYDIKGNECDITYTVDIEWEYEDLSMKWEFNQTININDLHEGENYISLNLLKSKFISSSVNPLNENDLFKIIHLSDCTCALGYDIPIDYSKMMQINAKIKNDFNKLIDLVNVNKLTYNKDNIDDIINIAIKLNIINSDMIDEDDYETWLNINKNITDTLMSNLQSVVIDTFNPTLDDGGYESISDSLTLVIVCR